MSFRPLLFLGLSLFIPSASAAINETDSFNRFIAQMVKQHHFNEAELRQLFQAANIQQPILDAMAKPAEAKPWYQYREIFMTESRIAGGVQFWRNNEAALRAVEQRYGVPAEMIIAIIGVETKYGAHTGKYRVIDALSTLAFSYPPRSDFFSKELEQFLILAREENMDPLQPMGSYAGAMGMGQFMPSSFRNYAVDFNFDGKRNIWTDPADAIASVANYFAVHHWQRGGEVAFAVSARGESYKSLLSKDLKPSNRVSDLVAHQFSLPAGFSNNESVKLLSFQQPTGDELWLGLHNFYVITRYNHSPLYAMAAYQLSQAIKQRYLSRGIN